MKRTDLALIVLIAAVSAGIAYFVAHSVFGSMTETKGVTIQTIDAITSTVEQPDTTIFNDDAINPSVNVEINNTDTAAPAATTQTTTNATGTDTDSDTSP